MSAVDITRNNQIVLLKVLNHSPADNTTYYFGTWAGTTTLEGIGRFFFNYACKIIEIDFVAIVTGVLGSAEPFIVSLRLNASTDTEITAVARLNALTQHFNSGPLAIVIADGDSIEIKLETPSWAMNPLSVYYHASLLIQRP